MRSEENFIAGFLVEKLFLQKKISVFPLTKMSISNFQNFAFPS